MPSHTYDIGQDPPIPTYEEATSSGPKGSDEIRSDAERQGLLGSRRLQGAQTIRIEGERQYQRADPGRSSEESDFTLPDDGSEHDDEQQRDFEEMEVLDPVTQTEGRRRGIFPKHFTSFTESISSIHLPTVSFSDFKSHLVSAADFVKRNWNMPVLGRVIVLFGVLAVVYGLVVVRVFTWRVMPPGAQYIPESVRAYVLKTVDKSKIEGYLLEVTYDDHVAGTKGDYFLAEWVEEHFIEAGLDLVYNDDYEVYLNYPRPDGRRVAIVSPPELLWEATLEEDVVKEKSEQHQVPVFHGHSRSGNVTGPLIYANYGSREDFALLKELGVDLTGSIALVRYYGTQSDRSLKVKAAELAGAVGCLIYSDPMEDGFAKGAVWPEGPWRTADSVQRGSVALSSYVVGDVLTPGWASLPNAERVSKDNNPGLNNIPSLPLAWRDAQILLQALKGHGIQVPQGWTGAVPDVEWWTGTSGSPTVNLMNIQDENERQPIRNVLGKIEGYEEPEKIIYVGNHRDAWCFGSVDPGSGTAVFLEVVRVFGELVSKGWRPRRTIIFASWDGEEYNFLGSTEHVEERIDSIRTDGVAYLNVDVGVGVGASSGTFRAAGSPLFERPLRRTLERVPDPKGNATFLQFPSLWDAWNASNSRLEGLGAGSDYVAFQDLAGCSSLDFGFQGADDAYPYHSCYETFQWMQKFGDPDFEAHAALGRFWALLILELSDEPLLPFDMNAYAREVQRYVSDLKVYALTVSASQATSDEAASKQLDTQALEDAAQIFIDNAAEFMTFEDRWSSTIMHSAMLESRELLQHRLSHNGRMSNFDTHLLDLPEASESRVGGVPGRTQFKHVIFGPQLWSGYEEAYFPAVRDKVEEKDWEGAQAQLEIVAKVLSHAAYKLVH